MANFKIGVAFAGTLVTALVLLQLLSIVQTYNPPPSFDSVEKQSSKWEQRAADPVSDDVFLLGAGKADITGPVVEVAFGGYAMLEQIGTGLRQRIYSRAFIVANPDQPDDTSIYLVIDALTGDTAVRHGVLEALAKLGGDYARYGERNVALTGTHSHSGPGAWMNYLLPQIPSKGFDKQSYQAIVDGVVLSIQRAHESLAPGRLSFGSIDIENANINRSPYSYDANPEDEKARYSANVDKTMTLLRFDRESDNKTTAILTFFPVHGTSMYNNNTLVTGDNKGVAAWLFERSVQDDGKFADNFVAGFSQSNVGDTSPNVLGAWCEDGSEQMCRYTDSTCGGKTEDCHGRGPFFREKDNGAKSCFEIGRLQYSAAKKLYSQIDANPTQVTGSSNVRAFHAYRDLAGYTFQSPFNSSMLTTCSASLGFSFAGGTTDGPGMFDFTQNSSGPANSNPLWYVARAFIHQPSKEQRECQAPKSILLDVGANKEPYPWEPNIVDIQVLRVGQLLIIISTSEATTMSGRRWKEAVAKSAKDVLSIKNPLVVLGAPSNSYAHYVATEEEYSIQRYEGASTLYGPNTLAAYINLTLSYLPYLGDSPDVATLPQMPSGLQPPINTDKSLTFIPGVVYDNAPIGKSFGDVVSTVSKTTYKPGETASTTFVGANPRNNLRQGSTFAAVERQNPDTGKWETVRTDNDWNLMYHWKRTNGVLGYSEVTLEWQIEDDYYNLDNPNALQAGTYRFHYYGDSKNVQGKIKSFEGIGKSFTVATN
ncbi:neutral/alkaline ceramidase [Aspergillus clavatus NRRL 1]|uniref:Neutral ceramidase n=1 Tax=Aspergillus clavatus (strain ATCC 1007 / CBS 513.65 / DSM 816 / NCTC 3887 / NRRL 1 / QM 1276 / 107) TaxID=344612 RepID=A1CR15_ASPCL|nr:neutral/alkaline nonlysosomal ceramidase, putative [Aspergillus clavatus NRRL 1]EAW08086.1 neutral/alkaline nonlysosomal ceramidase, putative [Aspergillus clavatus NRRL 1]